LKVQRRRCSGCGEWHRELPDIIVPYRRHSLETIELIINGGESATCTELATSERILKWWVSMIAYITGAVASIRERHGVDLGGLPPAKNLAKIVRALANANSWPCTRSALEAAP